MDVRQLRHFLAVIEEGTLGGAARRLNLTQPALSKSLHKLEDDLGAPLMERGPRGMVATAFGRSLARHARLICAQIDSARQEVGAIKGLTQGSVTLACGPSIAIAIVPEALLQFSARHPQIRVTVIEGMGPSLVGALAEGVADFVIAPHLDAPMPLTLEPEALYLDRVAIVGSETNPLVRRRAVSLDDLLAARWVLPRRPDTLRQYLDNHFLARGTRAPVPTWETDSVNLIINAIVGTDMLTFLPLPAIRQAAGRQAAGQLVPLRAAPCVWDRTIFVLRRQPRVMAPAAEALIACLRAVAARLNR